jgi:3-isopropylmalate/(R)-2-methylmalate dehydratase large subunit
VARASQGGLQAEISLQGNVLFLTANPATIAAQIKGQPFDYAQLLDQPLLDNISTDEIIPARCCYWYDGKLGDFAYLGLRDRAFGEGAVKSFSPQVIVSGRSKGCGSSREHAVYAEKYAGARIIFARSFERIYQQNCRNVGVITCDDFDVLRALLAGASLPTDVFVARATGIERTIISLGGLFQFNQSRANGRAGDAASASFTSTRPLNLVEKIIQQHLADDYSGKQRNTVQVGESYFIKSDVRFSHEYVTAMAASMFQDQFGEATRISDPGSCYFFQDHLSLSGAVLSGRPNGATLTERVRELSERQEQFAWLQGARFVGLAASGGSVAICHNYVMEHLARPGDVIIGTDSHTCTAGAAGALAFGVGSTDIANAWYNGEILVKVPEVIRVTLTGELRPGVCAKDLMLTLLAHPIVGSGQALGRVLAFAGPGCLSLGMDERMTLCNMAVEAGAMTALVEPDAVTREFLRAAPTPRYAGELPRSDDGATFSATVKLSLDEVEPMVALPGDPRNSVPLSSVTEQVTVDKVYGGSCTGGKAEDMDMYAAVFAAAQARGLRVADGVRAYIQAGSDVVLRYAQSRGYVELFEQVGVTVLPPSCGACINAGPGVSETEAEVTVSAQNRNYPGRSGPGKVYLASPYVVAASAIAGRLCSVEQIGPAGGTR